MTIDQLYQVFLQHPSISTDSRTIEPGGLFFALKGERFDGNRFAASAVESGSAFAIIDDERMKKNDRYIVVDNVLSVLQKLAMIHRSRLKIPLIAITGTNGKTTTKELITAVLSEKYRTVATRSNLNNHIGVPLTLLSLKQDTEIAIVEMGANHPGEIRFLCDLSDPDYGIITNIGKAHLEGFGGFEGVISTKTELYRYLQQKNGLVFVNADDPLLVERSAGMKRFLYGHGPSSGISGRLKENGPMVTLEIEIENEKQIIASHLYGRYNFENILAAAAIGYYFKVDKPGIGNAIEKYIPANNRSELKKTKSNLLILDAYNANPGSMKAAIENFYFSEFGNKVVILGDMLELGEESISEHNSIITLLEEKKFTNVYLVGPMFTDACKNRGWTCFQDSELAKLWFEHNKIEDSTILIKGSRGIKLENIVEAL